MALTEIQQVRLKTGIKITLTREVAKGNGTDRFFKLENGPIQPTPAIEVRLNGVLSVLVTDYTVDIDQGIVTFLTAPLLNVPIDFTYYWSVYSDEEVSQFITDAGSNLTVASAYLLLALAADAARLAKRQTLIGGGGIGQATIDTSVAAKELRETAKALIATEASLGESIPAEGLTEVPWTEAMIRRSIEQSLIRRS